MQKVEKRVERVSEGRILEEKIRNFTFKINFGRIV